MTILVTYLTGKPSTVYIIQYMQVVMHQQRKRIKPNPNI